MSSVGVQTKKNFSSLRLQDSFVPHSQNGDAVPDRDGQFNWICLPVTIAPTINFKFSAAPIGVIRARSPQKLLDIVTAEFHLQ